MRDLDDLAARALEHGGQPIDEGFEQSGKDYLGARAPGVGLTRTSRKSDEGARLDDTAR